jgi:hypothetical protein
VNLRLFKTPHSDPLHPNLIRLLFEGKVPGEEVTEESDYYIYVWINTGGYLRGFQAVLGNRISFAYHVPSKRSFGILARDIINRGVTRKESPEEREKIISAMNCMSNDSFPILLDYIKKLANGEDISEVKLSSKEMKNFSKIRRNR